MSKNIEKILSSIDFKLSQEGGQGYLAIHNLHTIPDYCNQLLVQLVTASNWLENHDSFSWASFAKEKLSITKTDLDEIGEGIKKIFMELAQQSPSWMIYAYSQMINYLSVLNLDDRSHLVTGAYSKFFIEQRNQLIQNNPEAHPFKKPTDGLLLKETQRWLNKVAVFAEKKSPQDHQVSFMLAPLEMVQSWMTLFSGKGYQDAKGVSELKEAGEKLLAREDSSIDVVDEAITCLQSNANAKIIETLSSLLHAIRQESLEHIYIQWKRTDDTPRDLSLEQLDRLIRYVHDEIINVPLHQKTAQQILLQRALIVQIKEQYSKDIEFREFVLKKFNLNGLEETQEVRAMLHVYKEIVDFLETHCADKLKNIDFHKRVTYQLFRIKSVDDLANLLAMIKRSIPKFTDEQKTAYKAIESDLNSLRLEDNTSKFLSEFFTHKLEHQTAVNTIVKFAIPLYEQFIQKQQGYHPDQLYIELVIEGELRLKVFSQDFDKVHAFFEKYFKSLENTPDTILIASAYQTFIDQYKLQPRESDYRSHEDKSSSKEQLPRDIFSRMQTRLDNLLSDPSKPSHRGHLVALNELNALIAKLLQVVTSLDVTDTTIHIIKTQHTQLAQTLVVNNDFNLYEEIKQLCEKIQQEDVSLSDDYQQSFTDFYNMLSPKIAEVEPENSLSTDGLPKLRDDFVTELTQAKKVLETRHKKLLELTQSIPSKKSLAIKKMEAQLNEKANLLNAAIQKLNELLTTISSEENLTTPFLRKTYALGSLWLQEYFSVANLFILNQKITDSSTQENMTVFTETMKMCEKVSKFLETMLETLNAIDSIEVITNIVPTMREAQHSASKDGRVCILADKGSSRVSNEDVATTTLFSSAETLSEKQAQTMLIAAYNKTGELCRESVNGCTFTACLVDFDKARIYSGNLGDTEAWLVEVNTKTREVDLKLLTTPHTLVSNEKESERIKDLISKSSIPNHEDSSFIRIGGSKKNRIFLSSLWGIGAPWKILANVEHDEYTCEVTRSFGDYIGDCFRLSSVDEIQIQEFSTTRDVKSYLVVWTDGCLLTPQAIEGVFSCEDACVSASSIASALLRKQIPNKDVPAQQRDDSTLTIVELKSGSPQHNLALVTKADGHGRNLLEAYSKQAIEKKNPSKGIINKVGFEQVKMTPAYFNSDGERTFNLDSTTMTNTWSPVTQMAHNTTRQFHSCLVHNIDTLTPYNLPRDLSCCVVGQQIAVTLVARSEDMSKGISIIWVKNDNLLKSNWENLHVALDNLPDDKSLTTNVAYVRIADSLYFISRNPNMVKANAQGDKHFFFIQKIELTQPQLEKFDRSVPSGRSSARSFFSLSPVIVQGLKADELTSFEKNSGCNWKSPSNWGISEEAMNNVYRTDLQQSQPKPEDPPLQKEVGAVRRLGNVTS